MGMTGFCVTGEHSGCPDTARDEGSCDCPCHITAHDDEGGVIVFKPGTVWMDPDTGEFGRWED